MQDENKEIYEDLFSQMIREKMQDHRQSIDESDWLAMQTRMKQANRPRFLWNVLRIASAAAAVIALVFYLLPIPELPDQSISDSEFMQTLLPPSIDPLETEDRFVEKEIPSALPVAAVTRPVARTSKVENSGTTQITPAEVGHEEIPETKEPAPVEDHIEEKEIPVHLFSNYFMTGTTEEYLIPYPSRKRSNRWQLSTGVSTSSRNNFLDNNYQLEMGNQNGKDPDEEDDDTPLTRGGHAKLQKIIDEEDYSYDSHALPFSVGFMVRSNITDRISVETGVIYTYLSSRLTKPNAEANLKQHYIGIPLNIICRLWEQDNWQIYLSAGGTVEKGVRVALHEQGIRNGVEFERNNKSGISGVQASAQISPGIEYALNQDWSVYLEPRLSYYFKSNQPPSVRTEHPLTLGIGGGLRYTF